MKFPIFSSINSGFVAETGGTAPDANGTATSLTLSPKKCISIVNVSAEAVMQNASIEAALRRNMAQSVASTLEQALLTGGSDDANAPSSIFTDANAGSTAAFTGATAITLESDVLEAGVQLEGSRMAYLMNPTAYKAIKQDVMVSGVSATYDMRDKTVNSYFAFTSANVGNGGTSWTTKDFVLFGDFSKVHIAQFGGLDVIYDIYSGAGTGQPRYVLTSLVDGDAVQNGSAFSNLIEA